MKNMDTTLAKAEEKGLLERDWQRIRPTERGRLFLNDLLALFIDDARPPPRCCNIILNRSPGYCPRLLLTYWCQRLLTWPDEPR